MRTTLAASAVLALAGSAHGFIVNFFEIQPNAEIRPSVGGFVNTYGSAFHTSAGLVSGSYGTWKIYSHYIHAASWLAADRYGGGGVYYGDIHNSSGTIHFNAPEWNDLTGNILGGPGLGFADPAPSIGGGGSGVLWGAGFVPNFRAPSAVSPVNGVMVDSIFFAHLVLTDPAATLVGEDLRVGILVGAGLRDLFLPLDGGVGTGGFRVEYERDGALLRAFVVGPDACCLADDSCVALTSEECRAVGGTPTIFDCASTDCSIGACCAPEGCLESVSRAECDAVGGSFNPAASCLETQCGVCCLTTGCVDQTTLFECEALDGVFDGAASSCAVADCSGACCYACGDPCGSCAEIATPQLCTETGGQYVGRGVLCQDAGCPTPAPPVCEGDLDGNGSVDALDFGVFAGAFGDLSGARCRGDFNCDGRVDVFDFGIFIGGFGCTE